MPHLYNINVVLMMPLVNRHPVTGIFIWLVDIFWVQWRVTVWSMTCHYIKPITRQPDPYRGNPSLTKNFLSPPNRLFWDGEKFPRWLTERMIKVSDWDSGTNLVGKLFGYIVWPAIDKRLTSRLGILEKYNQSVSARQENFQQRK